MNNGSQLLWSEAWQDCFNETGRMNNNVTDAVVHLLAIENELERNALFYWMKGKNNALTIRLSFLLI